MMADLPQMKRFPAFVKHSKRLRRMAEGRNRSRSAVTGTINFG
jgi:hypothetical protein